MINTVEKIYFNNQFISFQVTYVNSNKVSSVPVAEDNSDYQEIQEWIADGGTVIDNGGGE